MNVIELLQRKLSVGEELHSVVRTMKATAAVSIREHEVAVESLRRYSHTVDDAYRILLGNRPDLAVDVEWHATGRTAAIVFGSDQGLCGSFNRNIVHYAADTLDAPDIDDPLVAVLGFRAERGLVALGYEPRVFQLPNSVEAMGEVVRDLILAIDDWRAREAVQRVVAFHHRPLGRTRHAPTMRAVFPVDGARLRRLAAAQWPTRMLPDFFVDPAVLLSRLTREVLFVSLYRAIAESRTAEHGARLLSMQAAEKNIEDELDRLRARYRRLRQAEIDAQLRDVVSGYEASRS